MNESTEITSKTLDQKAAEVLQMNPDQVGAFRNEWERTPMATVVKAIFSVKLDDLIRERENKLRTCAPEELRQVQGELKGLQLARDTVNGRLV